MIEDTPKPDFPFVESNVPPVTPEPIVNTPKPLELTPESIPETDTGTMSIGAAPANYMDAFISQPTKAAEITPTAETTGPKRTQTVEELKKDIKTEEDKENAMPKMTVAQYDVMAKAAVDATDSMASFGLMLAAGDKSSEEYKHSLESKKMFSELLSLVLVRRSSTVSVEKMLAATIILSYGTLCKKAYDSRMAKIEKEENEKALPPVTQTAKKPDVNTVYTETVVKQPIVTPEPVPHKKFVPVPPPVLPDPLAPEIITEEIPYKNETKIVPITNGEPIILEAEDNVNYKREKWRTKRIVL